MQLNHLHYFYEVARRGSFTQAARALRVSQPSISKIVKTLEHTQGVQLIDRTSRRQVRLTPTGRKFFESCERIFGEVEVLRGSLTRTPGGECTGELAIGASDNLCHYLLPATLARFCRQHPKVQPRVFGGTSGAIETELLENRVDLGFFYTPVKDSRLTAEPVGFVEFWLVAPPKSLTRLPTAADALRKLPFIGSRSLDYATPYPALQMLAQAGIRPDARTGAGVIEANLQETQKRLVMQGLGYGLMPAHMVRDEVKRGKLLRVSPPAGRKSEALGSMLYAVRRKGSTPGLATELFKKALAAEFVRTQRPA